MANVRKVEVKNAFLEKLRSSHEVKEQNIAEVKEQNIAEIKEQNIAVDFENLTPDVAFLLRRLLETKKVSILKPGTRHFYLDKADLAQLRKLQKADKNINFTIDADTKELIVHLQINNEIRRSWNEIREEDEYYVMPIDNPVIAQGAFGALYKTEYLIRLGEKTLFCDPTNDLIKEVRLKNKTTAVVANDIEGPFDSNKLTPLDIEKDLDNLLEEIDQLNEKVKDTSVNKPQVQQVSKRKAEKEHHITTKIRHLHTKSLNISDNEESAYFVIKNLTPKKEDMSLEQILKKDASLANRLTVDQQISYSLEVLRGLQEQVHDLEIVHGDIKPANIIIKKGKAKYIDFGLSNPEENALVGTPLYIAPEAYTSELGNNQKTDAYSVGIVLLEIWRSQWIEDKKKLSDDEIERQKTLDQWDPEEGNYRLFEYQSSLTQQNEQDISNVIGALVAKNPNDRASINEAIQFFEQLQLKRKHPLLDDAGFKKYYALGKEAKTLSPIFAASVIHAALNRIPENNHSALDVFLTALHIKPLIGLKTKKAVTEKLDSLPIEVETKITILSEMQKDLQFLKDKYKKSNADIKESNPFFEDELRDIHRSIKIALKEAAYPSNLKDLVRNNQRLEKTIDKACRKIEAAQSKFNANLDKTPSICPTQEATLIRQKLKNTYINCNNQTFDFANIGHIAEKLEIRNKEPHHPSSELSHLQFKLKLTIANYLQKTLANHLKSHDRAASPRRMKDMLEILDIINKSEDINALVTDIKLRTDQMQGTFGSGFFSGSELRSNLLKEIKPYAAKAVRKVPTVNPLA